MSRKRTFEAEVMLDDMLDAIAAECDDTDCPVLKERRKDDPPQVPVPATSPPAGQDEEDYSMNEVLLALECIWSLTSVGSMCCALQHQLYVIYENRTFVDAELLSLREGGVLRAFVIPSGTLLMKTQHYMADIDHFMPSDAKCTHTTAAFRVWAAQCSATSVTRQRLLDGHVREEPSSGGTPSNALSTALDDAGIKLLVDAGFLLHRRDTDVQAFYFHHPRLGVTGAAISSMRKQLLAAVKRSRFKALSERQVAAAKLKRTNGFVPFTDQFHLKDLLGLGALKAVKTPKGESIFRLT